MKPVFIVYLLCFFAPQKRNAEQNKNMTDTLKTQKKEEKVKVLELFILYKVFTPFFYTRLGKI